MSIFGPVIKWLGGKNRLLPQFQPHFPDPKTIAGSYFEPFFGGGAVFFDLVSRGFFHKATIGDINPHLIKLYVTVRINPMGVWNRLRQVADHHLQLGPYEKVGANGPREQFFYKIREHWNRIVMDPPHKGWTGWVDECDCRECIDIAALMLFLNATAINGLWRENKAGFMNASFGDYEKPSFRKRDELQMVSDCFEATETRIFLGDFAQTCKDAKRGDLCYADPPYWPVSKTANFTSYSKGGFDWSEQVRLRDYLVTLGKRGVAWFLSNSHCQPVLDLYGGYVVNPIQAGRSINRDKTKRGPVTEVLITNYLGEGKPLLCPKKWSTGLSLAIRDTPWDQMARSGVRTEGVRVNSEDNS